MSNMLLTGISKAGSGRVRRHRPASLILILLLLLAGGPGESATPESLVGSAFRISQAPANERTADVAYDFQNNRYLVVWASAAPTPVIAGAIVNADGTFFKQAFIISTSLTTPETPRVAFAQNVGYFVVWEDDSFGGRDILGVTITAAGAIGAFLNVTRSSLGLQEHPDVAATSTNSFLVVWEDFRTGNYEIWTQPIVNGQLASQPNLQLTADLLPDLRPSLAPTNTGLLLLLWQRGTGIASANILGGIVDSNGLPRSSFALPISVGGIAFAPRGAFDSVNNRFVIAWELNSDIAGAILSVNFTTGAFSIFPFPIFTSSRVDQEPDIAFDFVNQRYLVVWQQNISLSIQDYDIVGRYLDENGTVGTIENIATVAGSDQLLPAVEFGLTNREFLTVWDDFRAGQADIWGQRTQPETPVVTVTAPNGGENWARNSTQNITWTTNASAGTTVSIVLLKAGTQNLVIAANTPNDGAFAWTLPGTLTAASDYRVRIASGATGVSDESNTNFSIDGTGGAIQVTTPNGGELWQLGTQRTIRWSGVSVDCPSVRIELLLGAEVDLLITASTANTGLFNWNIPLGLTPSAAYRVRITCTSDANNTDDSNAAFTLTDQAVDTITVASPNGGESLQTGAIANVTWNAGAGIANVRIELFQAGVLEALVVAGTPNDGSFSWTISQGIETASTYRIRISNVVDPNTFDESDADFTITNTVVTPLQVLTPNGGEDWPRGTTQQITWRPGSEGGQVRIELLLGVAVSIVIVDATPNDGVFAWAIPGTIQAGASYRVRISVVGGTSSDISNFPFSIVGGTLIAVTSPNGSELWRHGEAHTITWSTTGSPSVRIELLKGGTLVLGIVASTVNDGSHAWTIPATLTPGTDYRIRIAETSTGGGSDTSNADFTIALPAAPDLVAENFAFSPAQLNAGDPIQFTGQVVNRGDAPASSFTIEFRFTTDYSFREPTTPLTQPFTFAGTLNPNQSIDLSTIARTVMATIPNGRYTVGVWADPSNTVAEPDNYNNRAFVPRQRLQVGPTPTRVRQWIRYR